ncbi:polyprenyl synthetase family protein [Streptomyces sp. NPDC054796]
MTADAFTRGTDLVDGTLPQRTALENAHQLLHRARTLTTPLLREWVGQLDPPLRDMAEYHFGWKDVRGRSCGEERRGKGVRPALVFASAEAVGCRPGRARPAAVAVELLHNFSLVHDDIIDGDQFRHGRRTLWSAFDSADATLAGDALFTLAFRVLAETPAPRVVPTVLHLSAAAHEMATGQARELVLQRDGDSGLEQCVEAALGKTGALMGGACAVGAIAGGADEERAAHFRAFGRQLGLAFQVTDDILGLWGDPATTGKAVGADLAVRKLSLPVAAALASGTAAGRELGERYAAPHPPGPGDVARMTQLVEEAGGRDWAWNKTAECLRNAFEHLRHVKPAPGPACHLASLAAAACRRSA